MADIATRFGSLNDYRKGGVEIIDDDPRHYVFSNVFEVAKGAAPYDRIAVGKNFQYVIEAALAEGTSGWFTCAHDEFLLCMDGAIELLLLKLDEPARFAPAGSQGAVRIGDEAPAGRRMGRILLGRGHMALLPAGAAYRLHCAAQGVILFQTVDGPLTQQRWGDICQTGDAAAENSPVRPSTSSGRTGRGSD